MRRMTLGGVVCCMRHVPGSMVITYMGMLHEKRMVLCHFVLRRVLLRIVEARMSTILDGPGAVVVMWLIAMGRLMALVDTVGGLRVVDIVVRCASVVARQRVASIWIPPERAAPDGRHDLG